MATENSNIQNAEELVDKLQFLGMIPGPQQYYYQFLSSQTGLVTSLGDLIDKIDDGTVTSNDYIDVLKDIGAIGVSTAGLIALALETKLSPWAIAIGLGLAVLDYADENNYDTSEIYEDLQEKMSMLESYMNGGEQGGGIDPTADTDGDGLPDDIDPYPNDASPDSDGDGVPDYLDPYPNDPNNGNGHPMDPAPIEPPRRDPLVLDMDKDGFISTTSLEDSTAYFDLTGDGIKEKVGWLRANDGLVVYDKNENGKIDGIDEVFGNQTTSGFDELRQTADSNYDGVIDRRDELYSRLKVWQDTNQDGILNNQDEAFNYVLLRQDNNGGVTLFIPQVDNQRAKELFENTSWHVAQNNTYFTLQKKAA